MLPRADFLNIIKQTPLVAIDLIVTNELGEVLVGMRKNNPAKGWWFVPGGRILKDETLDVAFSRISSKELGLTLHRADAKLLGIYEHLYPDNVDNADFSTHYVVIGYSIPIQDAIDLHEFAAQHENAAWMHKKDLMQNPHVHTNTKAYFAL